MKNRLYFYFYYKIKSTVIANLLKSLAYAIFIIIFIIKKSLTKKQIVTISVKEARHNVNLVYPKPVVQYPVMEKKANENIDLSIIVPAFNVDKYICECIESILTLKTRYNYELIIVNDGSTDNTGNLLRQYEENQLVTIITQENQGLSAARNKGLNLARGKYTMFVDSDDILSESAVELLLTKAFSENIDIVQGGYYTFQGGLTKKRYYVKNSLKKTLGKNDVEILQFPGFMWGKVYKREIFDNLRLPTNYWYEDTIVHLIIFRICKNFSYIGSPIYGYRKNNNGITSSSSKSIRSIESYWIVEEIVNYCNKIGLEKDRLLYLALLDHLSRVIYYRTLHLDINSRKSLFILCCDLIVNMEQKDHLRIPIVYKEAERSFYNKDFSLWERCSQYI